MPKQAALALVLVLGIFLAIPAAAAPPPEQPAVQRVAVFPFRIFGPKTAANLSDAAQDLLIRQLREEGLEVPAADELSRLTGSRRPPSGERQAASLARRARAQFAIFGSLSQVGDQISLDARLVDVSGKQPTRALYSEQRGLENLAAATEELTQQATVHLLSKAIISEVQVRGNDRIESDAILVAVKSTKGSILRPKTVREDIKTIYQMGYFDSVDAFVTDGPNGKILTFQVREKPSVVEVNLKGNKHIKEKDILAAISTKPFTILQRNVVNDDVQRILKLYHEKAYFNAEVDADIKFPKDPRQATVTFNITENDRIFIKRINFTGNENYSSWRLRMIMETKTRNILFFFTDRGILQRDILNTDVDRLTAFYHDHGYMSAQVGSPDIDMKKDGFYITIPIAEGKRYKVESVDITGELLPSNDEIMKKLTLEPGDYFSREKLRKDLDSITNAYMEEGYAHTEITPNIKQDRQQATATITYSARQGPQVYIQSVTISGNTKTRDKVIRRQMQLVEGDMFKSSKLERSNLNLRKLDYFEQVEIVPSEGSGPDEMNLHIKVKEKPTGSISIGGGFSSDDGLFVGGDIMQRNLFGYGQTLALKAYVSGQNTQYSLSFTEPYLLNTPLSAGFDLYNWDREYTDFTKNAIGGKLRFSHPFGDWSRWYLAYIFEDADVTDVADDASIYIKDQEGRQIKSSIYGEVERDTTDHPFMPTKGSINSLSIEWSTPYLGSDSDYVKYIVNSGWYFPLFWKFIGFARAKAGYISEIDDSKPIPIYERFFLGGMNSLRAWGWGEVGPTDPDTGDVIGGTSFGLVNLELLFPLIEKVGIRGVVFFDAGNAFDSEDTFAIDKFRTDAGAGLRWNSPMGPLRIEYGYNLDRREGESAGKWQFSMGAFF